MEALSSAPDLVGAGVGLGLALGLALVLALALVLDHQVLAVERRDRADVDDLRTMQIARPRANAARTALLAHVVLREHVGRRADELARRHEGLPRRLAQEAP